MGGYMSKERIKAGLIVLFILAFCLGVMAAMNKLERMENTVNQQAMTLQYQQIEISWLEDDEFITEIINSREYKKILFPMHPEDFIHLTSSFGKRGAVIGGGYSDHLGLDMSGIYGARIISVKDGVIEHHWIDHPIYGKAVFINHLDGTESRYFHLSESLIHERRADGSRWKVKAGDVIGKQGATGLADGSHLHFEYLIDNQPVNPLFYVQIP
jgi:murein DD-endopeptidase MepM/ murein hydrolase activator NlpD